MDTTIFAQLPWLQILVATIAYFALGAIWYSFLFQKQWVAYHQIDLSNPDAKKGAGGVMAFSFILFFIATTGLAILVERLGLSGALSGVKLGLFTGFFFSMMALSITYLYLQRPVGLHLIDGLYHVTGQAIAALILCVWR